MPIELSCGDGKAAFRYVWIVVVQYWDDGSVPLAGYNEIDAATGEIIPTGCLVPIDET